MTGKRSFAVPTLFAAFLTLLASANVPAQDALRQLSDQVRSIRPRVFLIGHPEHGTGTGFILSKEHRLLATNAHVAHMMHKAGSLVAMPNDSSHVFKVDKVWYHPAVVRKSEGGSLVRSQDPSVGEVHALCADVAVLHIAGDDELPEALTLATPKEIADLFAKPVGMLGFPGHDTKGWPGLGEEAKATYRQGVIARATDFNHDAAADQRNLQFLQYTLGNWFGFSGSPVFLPNGHVVALNNSARKVEKGGMTTALAFGIRIDCLWELLAYHNLDEKVRVPIPVADLRLDRFGSERHVFEPSPGRPVQPPRVTHKVITNSIGMKLVLIPAGQFMMGSAESAEALAKEYDTKAEYFEDEHPQHRVRITKPFYLGVYEVTQAEYERVMGKNPSEFKGATRPVARLSWDDAMEFCRKLSAREGRTYRLPTEAEWEYACRAGTRTRFYWGNSISESVMKNYCWYEKNADRGYWTTPHASSQGTQPVGQKRPNAWGLYDMSGNVDEWCQDWYDSGYYADSPTDDPEGPSSGSLRVCRGSGWSSLALSCRSASRYEYEPRYGPDFLGFRVALVPAE